MANNPFITLYLKGKDLAPFKELVSTTDETMILDLAALHPVPNEFELREYFFSGRSGNDQGWADAAELISKWKMENWGVDDSSIEVFELKHGEDWMFLTFRVRHSAPVEFISYLTVMYPDVFIYLGYNDTYNPVKYSFVCRNGNVWPLKSEGMLTDFNGSAVFLDKTGNYRLAQDNKLIKNEDIDFYGAQNHLNYVLLNVLGL